MTSYESIMISDTPWECYEIFGDDGLWPVWVKRDDLCCEPPGPQYSKMRGLEAFLHKQDEGTPIGVQDAGHHSRSGWGTAYLCKSLGLPCYVFYPVYVNEGTLERHKAREFQVNARNLGATLIPQKAGRATVLWYQARKILAARTDDIGIMLPAGLKLLQSAIGTAEEVLNHTPEELRAGTWISAISSGTTMCGMIIGLKEQQEHIQFIAYFGSSKNEDKTREYMHNIVGYIPDNLTFVDEGWAYSDYEKEPVPFPCSKYYEAKAWHWMVDNIEYLKRPVVFWNIGD